ncbi:hypothetical protein VNI00_018012 [Paramarasmius palmivorus]|uniref:DUF6589 domain-containing protein n=1 Tax=Paramarasmius palmivorus TaxID=297713 RepID=A0AAW0B1X0_9AGAR
MDWMNLMTTQHLEKEYQEGWGMKNTHKPAIEEASNWRGNLLQQDFEVSKIAEKHFNYWNKSYYKAHGSNASWDWLAMIAPCVPVLRHLTRMMKGALGVDIGTKHAAPDLKNDIEALMKSLDENNVYRVDRNRSPLEDDDALVHDNVTEGLEALSQHSTNPLKDYNQSFFRLQNRRKMVPVIGEGIQRLLRDVDADIDQEAFKDVSGAIGEDSDEEEDDFEDIDELEETMDADEPTLERISAEDVSFEMDGDWEGEDETGEADGEYE